MKWHGNLLYVKDLTASVNFYSEVLGLPIVARPAPHIVIIALENGVLYLHEDPPDAPEWLQTALESNTRSAGIIVHIEVADLVALRGRLISGGAEISKGPIEIHGQLQLYIYDPSGYNLVFVQPLV